MGGIVAIVISALILETLVSGPVGWIISLIVAGTGGAWAMTQLHNYIRSTKWSPEWAKWLVDKSTVIKIKDEQFLPAFTPQVEKMVHSFLENNKESIRQAIRAAVKKELAKYEKVLNMEGDDVKG